MSVAALTTMPTQTRRATGPQAQEFRQAIKQWRAAALAFRNHSQFWPHEDRPLSVHRRFEDDNAELCGAYFEAGDQLMAMVHAVHGTGGDGDDEAFDGRRLATEDDLIDTIGVDIGEAIVLVGVDHHYIDGLENDEGPILMVLDKAEIIAL